MKYIARVAAIVFWVAVSATRGQQPAVDVAGAYDGKPAREWIEQLRNGDNDARRQAAYALGQIRPPARQAIPELVRALDDQYLELCWYAVDALGRIGPAAQEAVPAIVDAIKDPANDQYFRRNAATALGRIGPAARQAAPVLTEALGADDHVYRVAAATALWKIERRPAALSTLVAVLRNQTGEAPYQACVALLEIGPDAKVADRELAAALGHKDSDVRRAAAKALGRMGLEVVPLVAGALDSAIVDRQTAMVALGYIIDDTRRNVLYRPGTRTEDFAAAAKPLISSAVPALVTLLDDRNEDVRLEAARTLARMGPLCVPNVLAALQTDNEHGRRSALEALVQMERYLPPDSHNLEGVEWVKRRLVKPLISALEHEDAHVRSAALRAFAALSIGAYGTDAKPLLLRALKDDDVLNRRNAAKALERLP